jgi:inosose dehydratase
VSIRFACQTYSWQMSIDRYSGRVDHMVQRAADAGFTGFETEVVMLGPSYLDAGRLNEVLAGAGVELAALCLVEDWRGGAETDAERANADRVLAVTRQFPGAVVNLCQLPGRDRADLVERQRNLLACTADIARRAADAGVHCTYHPNSPAGSIFRTADDYAVLLDGLAPSIGYTPDVGHIVAGGMDPLEVLRTYRERVDHIHLKDIDAAGGWAVTGAGTIDFPGIVAYLRDTDFAGWVVLEDESPEAEHDPDAAVAGNGKYVQDVLAPLVGRSPQ